MRTLSKLNVLNFKTMLLGVLLLAGAAQAQAAGDDAQLYRTIGNAFAAPNGHRVLRKLGCGGQRDGGELECVAQTWNGKTVKVSIDRGLAIADVVFGDNFTDFWQCGNVRCASDESLSPSIDCSSDAGSVSCTVTKGED
jgi:hypothetical protein